jgi:hypothetical protein
MKHGGPSDLIGGLDSLHIVHVSDNDPRTFGGEQLRFRRPLAARRARDDRNLTLESVQDRLALPFFFERGANIVLAVSAQSSGARARCPCVSKVAKATSVAN